MDEDEIYDPFDEDGDSTWDWDSQTALLENYENDNEWKMKRTDKIYLVTAFWYDHFYMQFKPFKMCNDIYFDMEDAFEAGKDHFG